MSHYQNIMQIKGRRDLQQTPKLQVYVGAAERALRSARVRA